VCVLGYKEARLNSHLQIGDKIAVLFHAVTEYLSNEINYLVETFPLRSRDRRRCGS
jgi:hypothetical protein